MNLNNEVKAGEYAGKLGKTGDVSGAHLHVSLEYKIGGKSGCCFFNICIPRML